MDAIKLHAISKTIGYRRILHGITYTVEPGQLVAVTGPNGAGKTTLLKVLAGLMPKTSGTIAGVGFGDVGFVGHQPMVYTALTVQENLIFFAKLHDTYDAAKIVHVLREIGLEAAAQLQGSMLSRGMLQRLALGRLLVQNPRLCLLDEPFTGLDLAGQRWLISFIGRLLAEHRPVMVVSHNVAELHPLPYAELRLKGGRQL